MGCDCGKPKCDGHCGVSPAVLQINNPSECVLFHRVEVPASMGDSKTNPPKSGAYKNVLLYYEADQTSWLYSSDGIPQKLVNGLTDYEDAINLPRINGVTLIGNKDSADLKLADAPMVITIASGNTSWSGTDTAEDIYNFFLDQGKVNVVFEGSGNYGYEIVSAAYIPGEQKMMCMTTVASVDTGSSPVEFSGNALYGLMTFYTVDKAVDVGELDLQPKLSIADFTGLNMTDGYVLEGVPATDSSIGMVKPGDGLSVSPDGTLTVIDHVFDTVADMKASTDLENGMAARTLGFHTINDGGGALYKITNTGTANEMDVIAVGSLFASLIYGDEINLKQLGIEDNDDITDALELACSLVDRVIVSDGSYNMTKVQLTKNIDIKFINCNITKTDVESSNESGAFEVRGTVASTTTLSATATALSNTISVSDDTGLAVGDTIYIYYDVESDQEDYHKQFVTTITAVNSGSITIADALNWEYTSGCKVSKLNTVRARLIGENMTYNNSGLTGKGYFAYLRRNRNSVISGIVMKNSSCGVARILQSIDCKVSDCTGYIPVSTEVPYGEFTTIMYSTNVNVYHSHTVGYRRSVDYVGSSYCSTYDSIAEDGGFTTHGSLARYCNFINCTAIQKYNSNVDNVCGNLSFFYDKDIAYIDCQFINGNRGINVTNDDTTALIKGCRFTSCLVAILDTGSQSVKIEDCHYEDVRTVLYIEKNNATAYCTMKNISATSNGSGSSKVIDGVGVTNAVQIFDSTFEGSETFINGNIAVELHNCNILLGVSTPLICAEGTKVYNCYFPRDIKVISNCTINGSNFRNITVADGVISGTNIEGNLVRGTISLADGSGNHVANNTTIH